MAVAPKVQYRQLGKSGLLVSVPILGGMSFGSSKWNPKVLDEKASLEVLKAAWDLGINTIDTANIYSNGESERIIGVFIKQNNIPRHQYVIATKCFLLVPNDVTITPDKLDGLKHQKEYVNQYGLSRTAIFNAVEASLARLQTTYIDLLQIHRYDASVPAEETMKALHDLIQADKVRYIGASSMLCWQFAHLNEVAERNGWTKFVSMQPEYSLLYREEERETLGYCKFNGIGVIPYEVLAKGLLTHPVQSSTETLPEAEMLSEAETLSEAEVLLAAETLSDADKAIIKAVYELSQTKLVDNKKVSMAQIALAWAGQKVTSPIVGINSVKRVKDDIVNFRLTPEEVAPLEAPYVPKPLRDDL